MCLRVVRWCSIYMPPASNVPSRLATPAPRSGMKSAVASVCVFLTAWQGSKLSYIFANKDWVWSASDQRNPNTHKKLGQNTTCDRGSGRGDRLGLPSLIRLVVSVDVKQHWRTEFRSCVKVQVAVLGSPSLIRLVVSVDAKQHWTEAHANLQSNAVYHSATKGHWNNS